jgi:2-oxoglutarate ferredoxin oxidoreductase subunit alpha
VRIVNRKKPTVGTSEFRFPYRSTRDDEVLPMPSFGEGYGILVTGMTKDHTGFPSSEANMCATFLRRLTNKIEKKADDLFKVEVESIEDADVLVFSYGTPARAVRSAVRQARNEGIRAGYIRLITIWPFSDKKIREIVQGKKACIFVEMNMGQIFRELQRATRDLTDVHLLLKPGVESPKPSEILSEIRSRS